MRSSEHKRRTLLLGTATALVLALGVALPAVRGAAQSEGRGAHTPPETPAELYAFHCSTCHGTTGLGLEEARERFPADHKYCVRCHVPLNPPVLTTQQMEQRQSAFSLGDPPPLADRDLIAGYGNAHTLYQYIRATMPRWSPGRLTDEEYVAVTVHLLRLNGFLEGDATLGLDELADLELR